MLHPSPNFYAQILNSIGMKNVNKRFCALKNALVTSPVLRYPDFEKPFILYCDASDFGLGVVLSQKTDEDKVDHPIGYASESMSLIMQ